VNARRGPQKPEWALRGSLEQRKPDGHSPSRKATSDAGIVRQIANRAGCGENGGRHPRAIAKPSATAGPQDDPGQASNELKMNSG